MNVNLPPSPDPRDRAARARHLWSAATLVCTLFLIFVGGLVTSTGSALSVPDWPLSYGMLMPPMVGGVFYEHGHRMVASFVGLLTLVLALWCFRQEERPGVRRLAGVALATVCLQGILGGLTVRYLTPLPVSAAHACLAQTFLCLMVAMTYATSREWLTAPALDEDVAGLRSAAVASTAVVFVQLIVGAVMRHADAGLAIPDFPLAFGRLIPPFDSPGIAVHFAHRVGALVVAAAVGRTALRAWRTGDPRLHRPALVLVGLTVTQIALGATTVLTRKAVYPTTTHVAVGAAVLATSAFLALRARRLLRPSEPEAITNPAAPILARPS
jgi:cytochrome c oxidase assembly protein subunit 15